MQIQRLEMTASDLVVTLEEIKQHLIVGHDDDDRLITRYVLAAIAFAESRCERTLRLRRFRAFGCRWPCSGVTLSYGPVRRVEAVEYYDTERALQAIPADDWQVVPHNSEHSLSFFNSPPSVDWRSDAVSVTYIAGYGHLDSVTANAYGFPYTLPIVLGYSGKALQEDVNNRLPDTIKQAIYMLVGHWYENRESVVVGTTNSPVAIAAEALLHQERVLGV